MCAASKPGRVSSSYHNHLNGSDGNLNTSSKDCGVSGTLSYNVDFAVKT